MSHPDRRGVQCLGRVAGCRAAVAALLLTIPASGAEGDWPSFRGPNGSGLGTGSPPVRWDVKTGERVRWKTPIPGLAHSSPIVWGERVFLTTAVSSKTGDPELKTGWLNGSGDSPDESEPWTWKVLALEKGTGRTLWSRDAASGVPRMKRHRKATHANCTPATDGKHVAAFFGSEGLHCYDVDGKLLWRQDLGPLEAGPHNAPSMQWGFASSPLIVRGKVVVQCDALNRAFWASFDVETGRELRRVERREHATWATPAVIESGGRMQLVLNGWKHMGGYDLETGEELWKLTGGGDLPVPVPQTAGGVIYLTNGHGRSPIYAVRADARGDLTPKADPGMDPVREPVGLLWWKPRHGSYMPTPLVLDGILYVPSDNGVIAAFDARTGEERFRSRIEGGATFSASVVAAGGRLYFASEDGEVFVLQAGSRYQLVAKSSMGEVCMATPAISNGLIFIRTRGHLYCIGP
jgi:outer membrane protein assembly factor BamB